MILSDLGSQIRNFRKKKSLASGAFNATSNLAGLLKQMSPKGRQCKIILFDNYRSKDYFIIFSPGATAHHGPGAPHFLRFYITHDDTPHSVGLLVRSDRPGAETSNWQHTTLARDQHSCPRRDTNPQSQQVSGHRYWTNYFITWIQIIIYKTFWRKFWNKCLEHAPD